MKIGIVTTWFPAGGGYVSKAYRAVLEEQGHEVFIYARSGKMMKGDPVWDDMCVTWAPQHYTETGLWAWHLKKWVRTTEITHVIFNEQRCWTPVLVARSLGLVTGAYIDYYKQSSVELFRLYDFLVCNTKRHYSVFQWHSNCFYVPWGTDIEKFKPQEAPIRPVTFLLSAGWQGKWTGDRRGTLLALHAFRRVQGECRLVVYSQFGLKELRPEWQTALQDDPRIELRIGTFDPFPFEEGDVYVYPSRLDGIGLTLPEAVSSGLATLVTDSPPMTEFIRKNETGLSVKVEKYLGRSDGYYWAESICDLDDLTAQMQTYADDTELLRQHRHNARRFAIERLNWRNNAQGLGKQLQNVRPIGCVTQKDRMLVMMVDKKVPLGRIVLAMVRMMLQGGGRK